MNFEQEKIRLLWAGEWPLWQTAGLAFLLLLLAAWIYRKEAKRGTTGRLRWLLPSLRCLALAAYSPNSGWTCAPTQKRRGEPGKDHSFFLIHLRV